MNTRLRFLSRLACLGALVAVPLDASATLSAQNDARVAFTATGPAGLKIVGTTSELAAVDDGKTVTVTVTLTHLATGIELRDKHMREKYLETATYPTAVLTVPRASLAFPAGSATQSDAQGTVTLHGQTRPATFHYAAAGDKGAYRVDATLHLNMHDFGIVVPSYMGVTVKPDVDIDVHFSAVDH
jgi:polyisoprenoid-binding protein YceI